MTNTVVIGTYRDEADVERVIRALESKGFERSGIETRHEADEELRRWLEARNVPRSDADGYIQNVERGGRLVMVEVDDARIDEAIAVMQERDATTSERGDRTSDTGGARTDTRRTRTAEGDEVLEVTEEQLEVGKREVARGGVRVHRTVSERPVEEQVTLRDETLRVERRPADRDATDAEIEGAFEERTIEMTETDEEAVVSKRARVIEEVVISKDVEERTETVRDTVRRTDVEVEETGAAEGDYAFDQDRDHYREHHRSNYQQGAHDYASFEPAYRYGAEMARHGAYRGRGWEEVEPLARKDWERQNEGTWDEFRDAVRHGYARARNRT